MAPTFLDGDRVLANKLAYRRRMPQRGGTVLFRVPGRPGLTWIKRVIALPGDTVAVRGNEVMVNGRKLERSRVPKGVLPVSLEGEVFEEINGGRRYYILIGRETVADQATLTVPEETCYVLGDHRDRSSDSREFGPVPLAEILGDVPYIFRPAVTWRRFGPVR
jgi:signal peptidase I